MTEVHELENLLYLIRCAVNQQKADSARIGSMNLERLYQISRFHSLAALTYTAVESAWDGHPPQDMLPAGWKEARNAAIRNSLLFTAERKALESFCEAEEIWYLPLKGVLLQKEYPGLGLREMADNDILFDANFQEAIRDWFVAHGYEVKEYRQANHDSYHKPPVLNFEMHTALFETSDYPEWADYFQKAVARLQPMEGTRWGRRFTPEDFYLYMLAHMYKHFVIGGTGIRSLLDVYLFLRAHSKELNQEYLHCELERLNLTMFERQTRTLAEKLFSGNVPLDSSEAETVAYHLASGTYGSVHHRMENQLNQLMGPAQAVNGNTKIRYSFHRLFPDRAFMEKWCRRDAPFFLCHPRLMPLAYGYRLLYDLAKGRGKKFIQEQRFLWK